MLNLPYITSANRACSLLYCYVKQQSKGVWLLPVNVCPVVPLTLCLLGVKFIFIDISKQTLCVDIQKCVELLKSHTEKIVGIVYVRTYGFLSDTTIDFSTLRAYNPQLTIIDDRCLCIPGDTVNSFGADMVLYSTGHCKQIDLGGGGLAFSRLPIKKVNSNDLMYDGTDEEALYKKAYSEHKILTAMPKGWLRLGPYTEPHQYINIINERIPLRIAQRERLNNIYQCNLPSSIQFPKAYQAWRFNILIPKNKKQKILDAIFEAGLFASSHYHSANRLFDNCHFINSDQLFSQVVNLFNDDNYSETKAYKTCEVINMVLKSIN